VIGPFIRKLTPGNAVATRQDRNDKWKRKRQHKSQSWRTFRSNGSYQKKGEKRDIMSRGGRTKRITGYKILELLWEKGRLWEGEETRKKKRRRKHNTC